MVQFSVMYLPYMDVCVNIPNMEQLPGSKMAEAIPFKISRVWIDKTKKSTTEVYYCLKNAEERSKSIREEFSL